jgi:hypothetical protein
MVELFAQVWFLCAIAFVAGSAVTWLLFVRSPRPRHTQAPTAGDAPRVLARRARRPRHERVTDLEPPPPTEPALANLDTRGRLPRLPGPSAVGALDRLGVAGGPAASSTPGTPARGGPVDEPVTGDSSR